MKIFKTPLYQKSVKKIGITAREEERLFLELFENPNKGDLIVGGGGIRKIRLALGNRGKSKGARVIYTFFEIKDRIYLLWAYRKGEKENLSQKEINNLKLFTEIIREEIQ